MFDNIIVQLLIPILLIVLGGGGLSCVFYFLWKKLDRLTGGRLNDLRYTLHDKTGIDVKDMLMRHMATETKKCDIELRHCLNNGIVVTDDLVSEMTWEVYYETEKYEKMISPETTYCQDENMIRLIREEIIDRFNLVLEGITHENRTVERTKICGC